MSNSRIQLGARGEGLAREYLKAKGYEIVATNFRCQWGEADIIARDGACLVFIEVRTRRGLGLYGTPEESISNRKRDKLVATAETYIQGCSPLPEEWRIDFIAVRLDTLGTTEQVEHIQNAIELS